jgi:hypothetical protein
LRRASAHWLSGVFLCLDLRKAFLPVRGGHAAHTRKVGSIANKINDSFRLTFVQ